MADCPNCDTTMIFKVPVLSCPFCKHIDRDVTGQVTEMINDVRKWAQERLEIAKSNPGPYDGWCYLRDQGRIDALDQLLEDVLP